ncbi:enoyl-CoA hydratase-related protein [Rhodococcus koreensis]
MSHRPKGQPAFAEIAYSVAEGVAVIAFNRPEKLNAVTVNMVEEALRALDLADSDDNVRAVVLTGRGRAFCAGADLSSGDQAFDYSDRHTGDEIPRDYAGQLSIRLFNCLKPVIAAINGPAVGMGATVCLAADVRLASTSAKFGYVFNRLGIVPEGSCTWFLPRIVGVARAAEWLYSGRIFDAEEARTAGLVRDVLPDEDLLPTAHSFAIELATGAPVSIALTRRMLWRMLTVGHPMYAHRVESRGLFLSGKSPDAAEGVTSFLEKRPPKFTGRISDGLPDIFPDWVDPTYF